MIFGMVILHNGLGNPLDLFDAKTVGLTLAKRKAITLEVGMQNLRLDAALANTYFSPPADVPIAIFQCLAQHRRMTGELVCHTGKLSTRLRKSASLSNLLNRLSLSI